ncbi:carboxypeptidase-like regulatory domain-containing protein [Myroides sp. TSA_177.3]|uniref:carboxypeptidase-like regulatory domain-containing protein n=1 Tax=Myroides sp. TSA_177.3 TaxID=3415650 RepID=UPI0040459FF1
MRHFLRNTFVLCSCLLVSLFTVGQERIQGKVVDQANIPIEGALIALIQAEQKEVIQYTQSNAEGAFELIVSAPLSNLQLRIQHLDYAIYHHTLVAPVTYLNLTLTEQRTELEEIIIKPTPITQHSDTISYRVESFATKTDRVLEDVLKRLPGIEITTAGQIKYQGENINRFYVEGLDLMQGRYTAITKAISPDDISRVDVYEDHQPIKMLDGKVATGKPALNIRLKNKVSRAGTAKIGGGFSPFIWDVALSPMLFSRNFQTLGNYETNNTGSTLVTKMNNLYSFEEYDTFLYSPTNTPFLQIATNADPSIKQNRYWFNKSHLGNLNVLQKFKNNWELTGTLYYLNENNDANDRVQTTTIHYLNPTLGTSEPITYERTTSSRAAKEIFNAEFTLTQNQKQNYTKNKTTIRVSKDKTRGDLMVNTPENLIQQKVNAPIFQLQNTLSTLIPLTEKHWINFRSLLDFSNSKEEYAASPTALFNLDNPDLVSYQSLSQHYDNQSFYTKNAVAYVWRQHAWTFSEEYNFTFQQTHFNTDLYGSETGFWSPIPGDYHNQLRYQTSSNALHSKISFKDKRWSFNLNLPLNWTTASLIDKENNKRDSNRKLFLSPTFYAQYVASLYWTFKGNIAYKSVFTPLNQLYSSTVLNELNFSAYTNRILSNHRFTSKIETNYKDPFTGWFAYFNLEYVERQNPILFSQEIGENGQQVIQAIEQNNTQTTQRLELNINKLIEPISTTLKGNFSHSRNKNPMLINQAHNTVRTHQNTYRFSLANTSFTWLNIDYSFSYQQTKNKDFSSSKSAKTTHDATLSLLPFAQHTLLTTLAYQQDHIQQQSFSNTFVDLTYRYTFSKRKIDLELAWTNIFNYKEYNQVIINDIMTNVMQAPIRPRQFMASIRFSF